MPNWWDSYEQVSQGAGASGGGPPAAPGTAEYYDNWNAAHPQRPINSPSTSLPNPGDPTAMTGSSATGMVTPQRFDPRTVAAARFAIHSGDAKGAAAILDNDPGQIYNRGYAQQEGANAANLDFKQKMTAPMLDIVHGMRDKLHAAGPDIADMATGPNYGQLSDDPSTLEYIFKAPLPDTSGEFYQNARAAGANLINWPGHVIPGVRDYTQSWADSAYKARDLNLELHHLTKGIGAGVKAIPGTKNGGTSTDADQALVLDAVGEAMHAADAPTRNNILFDAENILRARAGQPRLPTPSGYQPSYLASKYGGVGTAPRPFSLPPTAAASPSAPGRPPPEAIAMLRQNSSAKMRRYFDAKFGQGASSRAMRGEFDGRR